MPVLVDDGLETIHIQKNHRQQLAASLCSGQRLLQAVAEQRAVGQLGQRIKMGDVLELAFVLFQGRDV